jgi:hypothetical protein
MCAWSYTGCAACSCLKRLWWHTSMHLLHNLDHLVQLKVYASTSAQLLLLTAVPRQCSCKHCSTTTTTAAWHSPFCFVHPACLLQPSPTAVQPLDCQKPAALPTAVAHPPAHIDEVVILSFYIAPRIEVEHHGCCCCCYCCCCCCCACAGLAVHAFGCCCGWRCWQLAVAGECWIAVAVHNWETGWVVRLLRRQASTRVLRHSVSD